MTGRKISFSVIYDDATPRRAVAGIKIGDALVVRGTFPMVLPGISTFINVAQMYARFATSLREGPCLRPEKKLGPSYY
jgi:hypothetical protein